MKLIQTYVLKEIAILSQDNYFIYQGIAHKIGIGLRQFCSWMKTNNLEEKYNLLSRQPIKRSTRDPTEK